MTSAILLKGINQHVRAFPQAWAYRINYSGHIFPSDLVTLILQTQVYHSTRTPRISVFLELTKNEKASKGNALYTYIAQKFGS